MGIVSISLFILALSGPVHLFNSVSWVENLQSRFPRPSQLPSAFFFFSRFHKRGQELLQGHLEESLCRVVKKVVSAFTFVKKAVSTFTFVKKVFYTFAFIIKKFLSTFTFVKNTVFSCFNLSVLNPPGDQSRTLLCIEVFPDQSIYFEGYGCYCSHLPHHSHSVQVRHSCNPLIEIYHRYISHSNLKGMAATAVTYLVILIQFKSGTPVTHS